MYRFECIDWFGLNSVDHFACDGRDLVELSASLKLGDQSHAVRSLNHQCLKGLK